MVIVVNTRLLLKDRLEGIGWFTYETLSRITRDHPEHRFIFLFDRRYDPSFVFADNVEPVVVSPPTRHPFLWYVWFEWMIPSLLKKYRADLFLSTDGYLSTRTAIPQLAVIHDLNFVHRPKDLPFFTSLYYNRFFPLFARKACRIATVSTYSKNDIISTYAIDPSKIDIVWSGRHSVYTPVEEPSREKIREKYTGGQPYFLYIGSLHPRKNVDGLLSAFELFKKRTGSAIKLVIVGGKMFKTGKISELYDRMEFREEVIFTGRIPVEEVRLVLGSALAVTFVPFFEGFGLPLTEGMSAGVPVICSNRTALPEIGGDAALYVDPEETEEIAEALIRISTDENLRQELISKGLIRQHQFTWDITADLLWDCMTKAFADIGKPL